MHYPEMWGFVQFSGIKVGQGKESFQMKPEEKAKFSLRQVYYRERGYFKDHGHFTDNIALLGRKHEKREYFFSSFVIRLILLEAKSVSGNNSHLDLLHHPFVWNRRCKNHKPAL